jgi:hypothetical protein
MGDIDLPLTFDDFNFDQGAFLDSGTTMFYAHAKVHKFLYEIIKYSLDFSAIINGFNDFCRENSSHCPNRRGNCFEYNSFIGELSEFFKNFPPVSFQLDNDVVYTWDPEDYLYQDGNNYCLPFNELP